jgi:hypothetical protein
VVLVTQQRVQVERRGVEEALARLAQQEGRWVQAGSRLCGEFSEDGILGVFQNAVQATQDGEGEDGLAVLGLLVVAAQKVGNRPDEGRQRLMIHYWFVVLVWRTFLYPA